MDQELLDEIQNIKEFKSYRVWCVNTKSWLTETYNQKNWAIKKVFGWPSRYKPLLVTVSSITGTTYEWI